MQITLDTLCDGISKALQEEGCLEALYSAEGSSGKVVSNKADYAIAVREEPPETVFEITSKNSDISNAVYAYFDNLKGSKSISFPQGARTVIVRTEEVQAQNDAQLKKETIS